MSGSHPCSRRALHEASAQNRRLHPRPAPAGALAAENRALPGAGRGHQQRTDFVRAGHGAVHGRRARASLESARHSGCQLGLRSPSGASVHSVHARGRVSHPCEAAAAFDCTDHSHVPRRFLGQPRAPVGLHPARHAGLGGSRAAGGAGDLCRAASVAAVDSRAATGAARGPSRPFLRQRSGERRVTPALHLLLLAWIVAAGVMTLLWLLHLLIRNAAIVDFGWAFLLPTIAILYGFLGPGYFARRGLIAALAA